MSVIQFEGKCLEKELIGKVWRDGDSVFCRYKDNPIIL